MSSSIAPIMIVGFDTTALDAIYTALRLHGVPVQERDGPMVNAVRDCYEKFWRHNVFWYPTWDFPEPMLLSMDNPSGFTDRCIEHLTRGASDNKATWAVSEIHAIGLLPMLVSIWPDLKLLYVKDSDVVREMCSLHKEFVTKMEYVKDYRYIQEDVVVGHEDRLVSQMHVFNNQETTYHGPRHRFTARCSSPRGAGVMLGVYETAISKLVDEVGRKHVIVVDTEVALRKPKKLLNKMKRRGWL